MFSLNTIRAINAPRPAPAEGSPAIKRCSYRASEKGVVLYSVFHGREAFIEGATARQFLIAVQSTNSATKKDEVVEAYFRLAPLGKQKLTA